ncbi:MAG: serine protease [Chloracidobacterium sp.]|uniref:Trypsin-like peptidase domain-containing protein n=1 Tax=Chloracidobacterium validum TaxID=2821543 RepID=A0ABX8BAD0_9BACT|nr:serine protease [Chloracidobacterium validum]QUW02510.1 trypsin-like peptidase domain-containing protein [Chloracidobacterium validum]
MSNTVSNLLVVSLTGTGQERSFVFDKEAVTIGAGAGCDVVLDLPGAAVPGAVAAIHRRAQRLELFVHDADHYAFRVNDELHTPADGTPIALANGDVVAVEPRNVDGSGEPAKVLVQVVAKPSASSLPPEGLMQFPEVDAGGQLHPRTATRFLRELVFALYAEMPTWVRAVALLLTVLIPISVMSATVIVFVFLWNYAKLTEDLRSKNRNSGIQIDALLEENEKLKNRLKDYEEAINFAPKIATNYRGGVCLIVGSYSYRDAQQRPLRYLDHSFDDSRALSADGKLNVSFEGTGNEFIEEFSGTGFVVADGVILTNRHIAQPWWTDPTDKLITQLGGKPYVKEIQAYFPEHKSPFVLKPVGFSQESDVAMCTFTPGDAKIPKLPIEGFGDDDGRSLPDITGQAILLMGFPNGVEVLVAQLTDGQLKRDLERRLKVSEKAILLAQRGELVPLVTQGHVTRLVAGRIVHDAATQEGGSGSPIFNSAGKVIGINAQVTVDEGGGQVPGNNLAVPIRSAFKLLREMGKPLG